MKFLKAVSFSYDDGMGQDRKLIEILDKYGLKGTFNLNSGNFGKHFPGEYNGKPISADVVECDKVKELYKNHEIAVHTYTHPNLTKVSPEEARRQISLDKKNLEELLGYEITGMAYPSGGVNFNDEVTQIAKECGIKYGRTTNCSYSFDLQENVMQFKPTIYHRYWDKLFELAEKFVNLKADKPQLFYIWGHSYEFDYEESNWKDIENFCKIISNKSDTFYGTNSEVLLGKWF